MNWWVYVSMPLVAAAIGYLTKRVAIEMMFRPLEFVGVAKPYLGWQGVVPRNSARIIRISAQLLTTRLVDARELFARLDPDQVARHLRQPLMVAVDEIAREVLDSYEPQRWGALPGIARDLVIKQAQAGAPELVRGIMRDIQANITEVLDVEYVAVRVLANDKRLMVRLVRDISRPEMAFIARCGVYFGLALGLVQTAVWALTHEPAVLPAFGAVIGLFTDWLAIKLVFFPRERKKILGIVAFQGIFQRRRHQVAREYGQLIASEVVTVPNLLDAVLHGPRSDRLVAMIHDAVARGIERQARSARPLVNVVVGAQRFQQIKIAAADRAVARVGETVQHAERYAESTMDIANTIARRMNRLSRVEYEGLLRPAFRQDEWKLITVGALIGALVGELQALLLLH